MPKQTYHKKISQVFLFACLCALLTTQTSFAQPLVIVRGDGQYPPNEMMENGQLVGKHIELIRRAAENLNIDIEFMSVPWARALSMMKSGEADAITYVGYTPERETFLYYLPGNIISTTDMALTIHRDNLDTIRYNGSLEDLKAFSFVDILDYNYGQTYNTATFLNKKSIKSREQLIHTLLAKRYDIGVINKTEFMNHEFSHPDIDKLIFLEPLLYQQKIYLGFSKPKKLKSIAEKFAREIQMLRENN